MAGVSPFVAGNGILLRGASDAMVWIKSETA